MAVYVIDASSLIALQDWRPMAKHPRVWQQLHGLIRNDRLIAPEEVYDEIRAGTGPVRQWVSRAERRKRLFRPTTHRVVGMARQIVNEFPGLIDYDRPVPQADPFVVALALSEGKGQLEYDRCLVITEEKFTPSGRPRIPHVCEARGLQYLTIHQTFLKLRAEEGWTL